MIEQVWDRTTSLFERRFVTNALLPVMLLLPAIGITVSYGTDNIDKIWMIIKSTDLTTRIVALLGYFLAAWFFASFVQSQWRNFVRLYEGYPLRFIPRINEWGVQFHRARMIEARKGRAQGHVVYYRYPSNIQQIMPTSLGNALRAAERYPQDRYGADAILTWPRLAPLVPASFSAQVDEFRGAMEFLVVVSIWSGIYTASSAAGLLFWNGDPFCFFAVLTLGSIMAWFSYRGAVEAAIEYGEQLRVGHDLYRNRLLLQLRRPLPANLAEERAEWDTVHRFIFSNFGEGLAFSDGASSTTPNDDVETS